MEKIILIDDEEDVRLSCKQTLELEGFDVLALSSAEDALDHLSAEWPGIVLTDVKMPRMNGFDLLRRVQEMDPDLPIVMITGHGDIAMAIQAIRDGAYDFVEKPAPPEYLVDVVQRALDKRHLVMENRALKRELDALVGIEGRIIGKTPAIEMLRESLVNIAETDIDVMLVGETGTGKELAARCLHDFSSRAPRRFVALNCGALPETIIESELFGHEAGAFTGADKRRIGKIEHAEGGTLFLDEIESMPLHLQVKLLRVLQERVIERLGGNEEIPVDIRVVAAAKEDLKGKCEAGTFREDLYYRLNVADVYLPSLRELKADIPLLFQHFVHGACARYGRPAPILEPTQTARLMSHDWPGNVRELKNAAERYVLGIPSDDLNPSEARPAGEPSSLREQVERFERDLIAHALKENRGSINETSAALMIPRKSLYLRMRRFGLRREDFR